MKKAIQKALVWLYVTTYFRHIYVRNNNSSDPINMLVLSHRNGAIDGFVYHYAFKKGTFLLARQLQKNFFLRFIFPGISIYRSKDAKDAAASNMLAIKGCLNVMKGKDGPLCIFPEGTSNLGPKHLPFFNGYAKMACLNAKSEGKTTLLPVAIVYDDPTCLGGSVWIVTGKQIDVTKKMDIETIQKKTLEAFEKVTLSYETEKEQLESHQTAVIASLSKKADYYECLKRTEQKNSFASIIRTYNKKTSPKAFKYKQTVIYPQSFIKSLWVFLITLPIVVPSLIINIIPISIGYWAGTKRKHDPNTISLWRALAGYPVGFIFYLILALFCPLAAVLILPFSLWGLHLYGAYKKHLYALLNFIFYHSSYSYFKEAQNDILSKL